MNDQIFSITGDKKKTLLAGPFSFQISSKNYDTVAPRQISFIAVNREE